MSNRTSGSTCSLRKRKCSPKMCHCVCLRMPRRHACVALICIFKNKGLWLKDNVIRVVTKLTTYKSKNSYKLSNSKINVDKILSVFI